MVDSLLAEYLNAREGTNKINILIQLSKYYSGYDLITAID